MNRSARNGGERSLHIPLISIILDSKVQTQLSFPKPTCTKRTSSLIKSPCQTADISESPHVHCHVAIAYTHTLPLRSIWISLAIAAILIFLAMSKCRFLVRLRATAECSLVTARVARIRQQRLQATRRANQVLPYSQADVSPVFPTTLWASRHFVAMGRNDVVRVESRDSQLPSYSTYDSSWLHG